MRAKMRWYSIGRIAVIHIGLNHFCESTYTLTTTNERLEMTNYKTSTRIRNLLASSQWCRVWIEEIGGRMSHRRESKKKMIFFFCGSGYLCQCIDPQKMAGLKIGDKVKVHCKLTGFLADGTIKEIWSQSKEALTTGKDNHDKYWVLYTNGDGSGGWSYGNILTKMSPEDIRIRNLVSKPWPPACATYPQTL